MESVAQSRTCVNFVRCVSDTHDANSSLFLERRPFDASSPGSKAYIAKNSTRAMPMLFLHQYIEKEILQIDNNNSSESDMINQSKETNAALLQRHYLQAAGLFHAQNQQVRFLFLLITSALFLV